MTPAFFFSHKDPDHLIRPVSSKIEKKTLKLVPGSNIKMSNFKSFTTKLNKKTLELHFSINNIYINRLKEVLFLGVIFDEHLL